jgi:tetratricopeptide (TPR) repeat protein
MTTPDSNGQNQQIKARLSPPDASPAGAEAGSRRNGPLLALIGFVVLLFAAAAVLFLLPQKQMQPVEQSTAEVEKPAEIEPDEQQAPVLDKDGAATSDQAEQKDFAEVQLARETAVSLKIEAESQAVELWGGEFFRAAMQTMADADQALARQDGVAATELYNQVSAELRLLLESRQQIYLASLEAGGLALSQENGQEAMAFFQRALAIEPASEAARNGLSRAQTIEAAAALYREALSLEESGDLDKALSKLDELLELDAAYIQGRQVRARVQAQLAEQRFAEELRAFYTALDQGDLRAAEKHVEALKKRGINPEQIELVEKALAEKQEQAFIASQRKRAEELSRAEQWQQALEVYDKILAAVPDALFALNGKTEAAKRAELDTALAETINRADRLQDDRQRDAALKLLNYARQMIPPGQRLDGQIQALEALIEEASRRIAVTFESDNETEVSIYHVGRLGSFVSKQIELKPGTYTVVGSRIGFRDVRKVITVDAGSATEGQKNRFAIRCEEPI